MSARKRNIIESLDQRVAFYRRSMVCIFVLGLLSGAGILCGKSTIVAMGLSDRQQLGIKVFCCLCIVAAGIATGSAFRRRILHLYEHRHKLLMSLDDSGTFPSPVRVQTLTEVQALFFFLLFLVAAISYFQYPIPELPPLLDKVPIRLIPIFGFAVLCCISVSLERKNPLVFLNPRQDFVERQQKQARIQYGRQGLPPAYWTPGKDFPGSGAASISPHQQL